MLETVPCENHLVLDIDEAADWAVQIERQRHALVAANGEYRPWYWWELHNPWSRAAACIDSWGLLDIAQSPKLLDGVAQVIGEDIVLFDTRIEPNPALGDANRTAWRDDKLFFPLDRDGGAVVRLPFGNVEVRIREFCCAGQGIVRVQRGQALIHAADCRYRYAEAISPGEFEFVIRYFPSTHRYLRDPQHPRQMALMNRYPWVNYSTMPLWQVRGEDRADNDFVTGFRVRSGRWTTARPPKFSTEQQY